MASYGVGAILRAERVRQGLSIDSVSRKTKISPRFLDAIEEENFDSLPGLVFARGFIRQYANLLKLDSESIVASLPKVDAVAPPVPEPVRKEFTPSLNESWDPRGNSAVASMIWVALAIAAGVGGYLYFNRTTAPPPSPSRQIAEQRPSANPSPALAGATETATSATARALPSASTPAPSSSGPPATNSPPGTPAKPVQVTLTASEPAWVSIMADGKNAFTGILKADEKKQIDADELIKMTAGNAGGLKISLNGKELDPLGPRGQVRTVRFTAAGPQVLPRISGAPPLDPL